MAYLVNPDETKPWNDLPDLPIDKILYEDIDVYRQLGDSKAAAKLQNNAPNWY